MFLEDVILCVRPPVSERVCGGRMSHGAAGIGGERGLYREWIVGEIAK